MQQDFQIVDINNTPQKMVCIQFMYKGYLVSASKILIGDVIAFHEDDLEYTEAFHGNTIEDVIDQINNT